MIQLKREILLSWCYKQKNIQISCDNEPYVSVAYTSDIRIICVNNRHAPSDITLYDLTGNLIKRISIKNVMFLPIPVRYTQNNIMLQCEQVKPRHWIISFLSKILMKMFKIWISPYKNSLCICVINQTGEVIKIVKYNSKYWGKGIKGEEIV